MGRIDYLKILPIFDAVTNGEVAARRADGGVWVPRSKQPRNVSKARELRQNLSLPEVLLWRELRQQEEVSFRRQHPIDPYFLDFYCAKAKVCIEIDGIAHDMGDRPTRDEKRDAFLGERGIEVVRIAATEVLADPSAMADSLVRYCKR